MSNMQWQAVAKEEAKVIEKRRAAPDGRVGLAISGGGIRSATFALGVLESLKEKGLLKKIDYLSTVSGGGYIGSWLSSGCLRCGSWLDGKDWTESIGHLRRYSNYLSPEVGFFSADTWSMATIWFRNALLIQATVILGIACALLVPRPLFILFQQWPNVGDWRWTTVILFIAGIVGVAGNQLRLVKSREPAKTAVGDSAARPPRRLALLQAKFWPRSLAAAGALSILAWLYGRAMGFDPFGKAEVDYLAAAPIALLLVAAGFALLPVAVRLVALAYPKGQAPEQINYTQSWVQGAVVAPLMVAGFLVAAVLWGEVSDATRVPGLRGLNTFGLLATTGAKFWPFPLSVVFASFWVLSFSAIDSWSRKSFVVALAAPIVAVPVLHALLCVVVQIMQAWGNDDVWKAFVWGPPLVTLAFVLSIVVLIGMMGRQSNDGVREWWSRLGAWLGIYATAWMVVSVSAVYGPQGVDWALNQHFWTALTAGGGWIGTIVAGLLAGNSETTGTGGAAKSTGAKAKEFVAALAPYLFIAGVLLGVAYAIRSVITLNVGVPDWPFVGSGAPPTSFLAVSFAALLASAAGLVVLAVRLDINVFSLNEFYRNRLVRCYLGATRTDRREPQNFTGFDDKDDIPLADLATDGLKGPLHIVNCALNLGGSSDLALHTRHSATFTLNPLYCGSAYESRTQSGDKTEIGFIETSKYGGGSGAPTLGQAISVSGAAASPNMGYHTSPVVAFLLTLFNVRLGWWFPHPQTGAGSASPGFSLKYLLAELFGGAHDKSSFLMVSDGGHFENLAAYELVRRRCRVIIISDGECDPKLAFEGLGTLIRMCKVDHGATIDINVKDLRLDGTPWSNSRWAAGTITYKEGPPGVLVYLKASMNSREDTPIRQYKSTHPTFPHESTGDQFYREDQFESYRSLGREIGQEAFDALRTDATFVNLLGPDAAPAVTTPAGAPP